VLKKFPRSPLNFFVSYVFSLLIGLQFERKKL